MPSQKNFRKKSKKSRMPFNKSQVKAIKKITNSQAELKFVDSSIAFGSIQDGSVNSHELPMMAVGDTESTREGNRIRLIRWKIRGTLAIVEAGKDGALCRIFILRIPAVNVDGGATTSDFSSMTVNGFYPRDIPYKYKIMYDKTFYLSPDNSVSQRQVNILIKPNEIASFDGTLAADLIDSRYVLFATSNHSTASEVTYTAVTRNQYTDL